MAVVRKADVVRMDFAEAAFDCMEKRCIAVEDTAVDHTAAAHKVGCKGVVRTKTNCTALLETKPWLSLQRKAAADIANFDMALTSRTVTERYKQTEMRRRSSRLQTFVLSNWSLRFATLLNWTRLRIVYRICVWMNDATYIDIE